MSTGRAVTAAGRTAPAQDSRVKLHEPTVVGLQERRRRRRAIVPPMYSWARVRVLAQRDSEIEAHVLDISETGMALEMDSLVPVGQPVTIEFRLSGLGRIRDGEWTEFAAAAEIVRHDQVDDFPGGPYKVAVRFVQMPTMAQAQIARFVATHPG